MMLSYRNNIGTEKSFGKLIHDSTKIVLGLLPLPEKISEQEAGDEGQTNNDN